MRFSARKTLLVCLSLCLALCCCAPPDEGTEPETPLNPETLIFTEDICEEKINWYGRCYYNSADATVSINNSSSGFEVRFYGTELKAEIISTKSNSNELAGNGYFYVFLDGETSYKNAALIELGGTNGIAAEVVLAQNLEKSEHTLKLLKITEVKYTQAYIKSITSDGGFRVPPPKPALKFEIIGDSITAGANAIRNDLVDTKLTASENSLASYGAVAAKNLGAQSNTVCRSGITVSGGTSGTGYPKMADYYGLYSEKDTAAWDFSKCVPDVVILDLGTNDKLLSLSDAVVSAAYKNLVDEIRRHYPPAYIFCCTGAMGDAGSNDYSAKLNTLVGALAGEYNANGDEKIYHVALAEKTTAGHPKEAVHRTNGNGLTYYIRAALGLAG